MAKAKADFTANVKRVNTIAETIAQATQDVQEVQEVHEVSEKTGRKTYTDEELAAARQTGKTQGKKGAGLHRINMGFYDDVWEYISLMAGQRGESRTTFVNAILRKHLEEHKDTYKQAKQLKENSL